MTESTDASVRLQDPMGANCENICGNSPAFACPSCGHVINQRITDKSAKQLTARKEEILAILCAINARSAPNIGASLHNIAVMCSKLWPGMCAYKWKNTAYRSIPSVSSKKVMELLKLASSWNLVVEKGDNWFVQVEGVIWLERHRDLHKQNFGSPLQLRDDQIAGYLAHFHSWAKKIKNLDKIQASEHSLRYWMMQAGPDISVSQLKLQLSFMNFYCIMRAKKRSYKALPTVIHRINDIFSDVLQQSPEAE
jgi:hypothetical protein